MSTAAFKVLIISSNEEPRLGLTSTKSKPTSLYVFFKDLLINIPSSNVRPFGSGVPVEGASFESSPSISKLRCKGQSPRYYKVYSIAASIPIALMS